MQTTYRITFKLLLIIFIFFGTIAQAQNKIVFKKQVDLEVDKLRILAPSLKTNVIKLALIAYHNARKKGLDRQQLLTIIDYSKPSTKKRFYVFDLKRKRLFFKGLVSHGKNSGAKWATRFSNSNNSKESSIGVFLTGRTYYGHKGYSLNLRGLERGYNDHAYQRRIVIHGANYVSQAFVNRFGRLGLSWGCPALSKKAYRPVINKIKNGSIVFAYYPQRRWLRKSTYLHV